MYLSFLSDVTRTERMQETWRTLTTNGTELFHILAPTTKQTWILKNKNESYRPKLTEFYHRYRKENCSFEKNSLNKYLYYSASWVGQPKVFKMLLKLYHLFSGRDCFSVFRPNIFTCQLLVGKEKLRVFVFRLEMLLNIFTCKSENFPFTFLIKTAIRNPLRLSSLLLINFMPILVDLKIVDSASRRQIKE